MTMNKHQELGNLTGDNLGRARAAFRNRSPEQMQEMWGKSRTNMRSDTRGIRGARGQSKRRDSMGEGTEMNLTQKDIHKVASGLKKHWINQGERMEKTDLKDDGTIDRDVKGIRDILRARADNAYVAYIDSGRKNECLGWEAKLESGEFGEPELRAHKLAAEQLGRHRALAEAAKLLGELLPPNHD